MQILALMLSGILLLSASPGYAASKTTTVNTGIAPQAIAVNPVTNKIYVANRSASSVTVIDGATGSAKSVTAGNLPIAAAVNTITNRIYVANINGGDVTVINGATDTVVATVPVGLHPTAIAVNPANNRIYVANQGDGITAGSVTVIDGSKNTVLNTVTAGVFPAAVAVNPVTGRVYVTNQSDNNVTVIDEVANSTSTVSTGQAPYGIGVNPVTDKVYVANVMTGNITVIDGATSTAAATVGTSLGAPQNVVVNPVTNRIYIVNFNNNNVSVVDGATDSVIATVATGTHPWAAAVNSTTNQIYVANRDSDSVTLINGADNTTATINAVAAPVAVAVNPVTNRVYVANYAPTNRVTVLDGAAYASATVTTTTWQEAVVINPLNHRVYITNPFSDNVTIINQWTNAVTTLPVGTGPRGAAVNLLTNKIYVANTDSGTVSVIDGVTNTVAATVPVGTDPDKIAVNPVTNKIYVVNSGSNNVSVINGATDTVVATVLVEAAPWGVAVNPATNRVYVTNSHPSDLAGTVSVIDGATDTVLDTVAVGKHPEAVAVNPLTNKIYVGNNLGASVTVINGATNTPATVTTGNGPMTVAVNPITNKIYVVNVTDGTVTVINGNTDVTVTVNVGQNPGDLAINLATNRIYVSNSGDDTISVIDGTMDTAAATVPAGDLPGTLATDPTGGTTYVANVYSPNVTVINEQLTYNIPLTVTITPLSGDQTSSTTPTFTFSANNGWAGSAPNVFFQVDTWEGQWQQATYAGANYAGTTAALTPGTHILYAYATEGQDASSVNTATPVSGQSSPLIGEIEAYIFHVMAGGPPPLSANANLSDIVLSDGYAIQNFSPATTSYTVNVPNSLSSITVSPLAEDQQYAGMTINGSNTTVATVNLIVGDNTVTIIVTAEDGTTTKTYTVTITRADAPPPPPPPPLPPSPPPLSANATLSALTVSEGTLTPAFGAGTTSYTLDLPNAVANISVVATAADPAYSGLTINGSATASGLAHALSLNVGANPVAVVVTAPNGTTTKTYTVTVNRAAPPPPPLSHNATLAGLTVSPGALTPAFAAGTTAYTVDVPASTTSVEIAATAADDAYSGLTIQDAAVASGAAHSVSLNVGANPVAIVVTAEDGTTTRTYTVTVHRAAKPPFCADSPATICATVDPAMDQTVQSGSGALKLEIPAGAIEAGPGATAQVSVAPMAEGDLADKLQTATPPDGFHAIGMGFEMKAEATAGGGGTVAVTSFSKPVTLTVTLTAADLQGVTDPDKLGLFRLNADGTLTLVGGRLVDGNKLVVTLHGFSMYVLAEVQRSFPDLTGHWAQADVEFMAAKYVVQGLPDGRFDPSGAVTRAQFAVMLVRAMGLPPAAGGQPVSFSDVKPGDWFYAEVMAAVAAGIVKGYDDGSFRPEAPVTREQVAVMVARALQAQGKAGPALTPQEVQQLLSTFTDAGSVSAWAQTDLALAVRESILRGQGGALTPADGATRAEAAVMIARFWRN